MPLPDITTSRLRATTPARRWKIDVDVSAAQDGSVWKRLMGQTDCTVNTGTAGLQNDSDYDSDGFQSQSAVTQEWGATSTVRRAPTAADGTQYDPAQEFVRGRARSTGTDNTVHVRLYEELGPTNPRVESYEGYAASAWANGGGDQSALSTATITLTGQGVLLAVPHPSGVSTVAPVVSGVRYANASGATPSPTGPTAAAGGGLLYVDGSGFSAATIVTVFGNAATDWDAVTDRLIALKAPAHAAGTGDVVVTSAGGTSGTSAASKVTYA